MEVGGLRHRFDDLEPSAVLERGDFRARGRDFRAIENGAFVLAAAQGGQHENGRETFGHSLIVDPWGRILAEGDTEPGVILAMIDPAEVTAARAKIPSLQHGRRFEIIEPMAEPAHLHAVRGPA